MPKINPEIASEGNLDLQAAVDAICIQGEMKIIAGVARKVNTGNFENIDLLCAVGVPLYIAEAIPLDSIELLQGVVERAATVGFAFTSKETGDRYTMIKEMQAGGRK